MSSGLATKTRRTPRRNKIALSSKLHSKTWTKFPRQYPARMQRGIFNFGMKILYLLNGNALRTGNTVLGNIEAHRASSILNHWYNQAIYPYNNGCPHTSNFFSSTPSPLHQRNVPERRRQPYVHRSEMWFVPSRPSYFFGTLSELMSEPSVNSPIAAEHLLGTEVVRRLMVP